MTNVTVESYASRLAETLPRVQERIQRAIDEAGRPAGAVRLVAVTKAHPLEAVDAALAAGLTDLGENRVEELETKVGARGRGVATWHMIGHLQSRKARTVMSLADLIHSVDTIRLAERLSRFALAEGQVVRVLAQVNTSGEAAKSGLAGSEAVERIHEMSEMSGLSVEGLMTMAPFVDDERVVAGAFAGLREIHQALGDRVGPELSMGMTNDLEIAIREGSTMVRIGTALFGERVRIQ